MHLEHADPAIEVRPREHHHAVEPARSQESRIEYIGAIGRGNENHTLVALEPVHFDEELVKGLLAFVMTAAESGAAMPAHGVYLIDEDDAGRVLLTLFEEVT